MDDISLGVPAVVVIADVALVKAQGTPFGLVLNEKKCETITTLMTCFSSTLFITPHYIPHCLKLLHYKDTLSTIIYRNDVVI